MGRARRTTVAGLALVVNLAVGMTLAPGIAPATGGTRTPVLSLTLPAAPGDRGSLEASLGGPGSYRPTWRSPTDPRITTARRSGPAVRTVTVLDR